MQRKQQLFISRRPQVCDMAPFFLDQNINIITPSTILNPYKIIFSTKLNYEWFGLFHQDYSLITVKLLLLLLSLFLFKPKCTELVWIHGININKDNSIIINQFNYHAIDLFQSAINISKRALKEP